MPGGRRPAVSHWGARGDREIFFFSLDFSRSDPDKVAYVIEWRKY